MGCGNTNWAGYPIDMPMAARRGGHVSTGFGVLELVAFSFIIGPLCLHIGMDIEYNRRDCLIMIIGPLAHIT